MPPLPPGTASRTAVSVWTMWRRVCSQPLGIPVVPPLHSRAASASRFVEVVGDPVERGVFEQPLPVADAGERRPFIDTW